MPTIPQPARISTSRAVIALLVQQMEDALGDDWTGQIANPTPFASDQESETYAWLSEVPKLREWLGGRQAVGLSESGFTIRNRKFESTIEIAVDWMRRDKTGQIRQRINELADADRAHWAELLTDLIIAAEDTVCYDGQYFFDSDHPDPSQGTSATQSNDLTYDSVSVTVPTTVEFVAATLSATKALLKMRTEKGRYLNAGAKRFTLMVPVDFMDVAAAALGATVIADTVSRTNTIQVLATLGGFGYDLVINPRLTWTTKFALFRGDRNAQALIRQQEQATQVSAIAEGSELEFQKDVHQYGLKAIRGAGLGRWQHSALLTFV
jgi:phage major head subunit gpT-like protein